MPPSDTPKGRQLKPDPDAVRSEFADRLERRLNQGEAASLYNFRSPRENLQVVQVDNGQLTGHVYGLPVVLNNPVKKKVFAEIAALIQHIVKSAACALDDSGIAVYSAADPAKKGPDGKYYSGHSYFVHNSVSDANNPAAPTVSIDGKVISGNQPITLNIYQITVVMRGMNPTDSITRAALFVDRIQVPEGVQQIVSPNLMAMQFSTQRVTYDRFHAPALS